MKVQSLEDADSRPLDRVSDDAREMAPFVDDLGGQSGEGKIGVSRGSMDPGQADLALQSVLGVDRLGFDCFRQGEKQRRENVRGFRRGEV